MTETANRRDLDGHMNMISKDVSVFGVPGFDVIGYEDWFNQCKHEFENKLLRQVRCKGLNVLVQTSDKIMFNSVETVESKGSTINSIGIEFIIQKEADGMWHVSQEQVLPGSELENDIRRGTL